MVKKLIPIMSLVLISFKSVLVKIVAIAASSEEARAIQVKFQLTKFIIKFYYILDYYTKKL